MKQSCIFLIVCIFIFNTACFGFSSEDFDALRVPLISAKKDPFDIKVEFESILKEMPKDIPIKEGVEIIRRCGRLKEIIKYLEKFENLKKLFSYESNMWPLFVETRRSPEDLDRSAAEILSDKELMVIFDVISPRQGQVRQLLARAILVSDDARRTIKTFIRKPGSEEVFSRVWGEFIAAYLASRKTREAAMTLLNTVSPGDFSWKGRMKYSAPDFGQYYNTRADTYYGLFTLIWFYLTPVYEKLRARGYTFEEAGEAFAYLCEHILDKGFGVPPYNYSYEAWLSEDEESIKEHTRSGVSHAFETEQFKTMMDIIKTSPKGIPPAASFVDKTNEESLKMRDICRSMRDGIELLGKKFMGKDENSPYYRLNPSYSYLAEFPLCQLYERLLFYAWFSRPWECETQDDATAFSFKLHYYTPLLSEWTDSNNEHSLINTLAKAGVDVTEDEKARLRDVLQNIKEGIEELKAIAMEIPPPVYREDVNVNHLIEEILKEGSYEQIQLDICSSLPSVNGKRVLLKEALRGILRRLSPLEYLWEGITIKTAMSSGEVHIIVYDVPIDQDLEVIKIMLNPRRLYSLEDRLHVLTEGKYFSEAAAIIKAHGGEIDVQSQAGKGTTFTITLPLASEQGEEKSPTIHLIAGHHKLENYDLLQDDLIKLASENKIVLGVEGIERNYDKEQFYVSTRYKIKEKGLVFGIEDDFAFDFSSILRYYSFFILEDSEEIAQALFSLPLSLIMSDSLRRNWNKLEHREIEEPARQLYNQINNFILDFRESSLEGFFEQFPFTISNLEDLSLWSTLIRCLADEMVLEAEELPKELELDSGLIRNFLHNPEAEPETIKYILDEVALEWRNKFIFKNIREIVDIAIDKNLEVYFIIGDDHLTEISEKIKTAYQNINKKVYTLQDFAKKDLSGMCQELLSRDLRAAL